MLSHATKKQAKPACGTTYWTICMVSATIQWHGKIKKWKEKRVQFYTRHDT